MPIYEYFCSACQTQSEISHRMSDPSATICPVCGKPALTKQMSAAAFRLKGAGWYETDFKSEGKKNLAGEAGAVAPPAAVAAADSKPAAEAKPAVKTEAAAPKAESKPAPAAPSTPST
ncbi:MAG: zinc ribbon protein [Hydrocarboniphaga sp.]|uniref:FmdB family zinc ribbon protein n=1 Tax=Hydrocarboniphaga sp. TaxID=2033016 RepID=UPI00260E6634|nr:zinc ribbon domain-containing protein [Hydrocarboniphaga sp.]MDB5968132.1 zinc ribbon protein [Hydrocarboniphaga sp.]